ncbi:MAG: hypothetical protein ACREK6_13235 [Candidatus Rokuibacteriota bacterium]
MPEGSDTLISHSSARLRSLRSTGLVLVLVAAATACSPSIYAWTVRTHSTPPSGSFHPAVLEDEPVAIFEAQAPGGLRGNELGLASYLADILAAVAPKIKVVSPQHTATRINTGGLAAEYLRMRTDFEHTNMLEAASLQKLGAAIGARYVFQPRLGAFTQTMTNRWTPIDLRIVQTRSSVLRLSLQLWDSHTGEPIWSSVAEAIVSGESFSQDPVFLEDAARLALGSAVADLLRGKTASTYTTLSEFLNKLIQPPPEEQKPPTP